MNDEVVVGGGNNYWHRSWTTAELLGPLPPPPEFSERIESVRVRIAKIIGKISVPHDVRVWHPAIDRMHSGTAALRD
jgi:hypothetical protein